MSTTKAISNFLARCRVECGMAENTISAYRSDLSRLFAFLGDVDPMTVTARQISDFIAQSDDGASTVKRRLACYRQFFRFCGSDVAAQVEVPKQAQRLPKPISADVLRQMIDGTEDIGDRLVLELLYSCGLRASEIATATIRGTMVHVLGKGAKERLVPAPEFVREWLPRAVSRPHRSTVYDIVQRAAARVGIDAHPHQLRHSFATHLLQNGCPINAISSMMGHESLCTTAGYMALDVRAKRECIKKHHPRG